MNLDTVLPIPRIPMPSRATFEKEFLEPCRPVIITGAMSNWHAMQAWSAEFFRSSAVGKRVLPIEHYPNENRYNFPNWNQRLTSDMRLCEYMELATSDDNRKYYCADQDIDVRLPELLGDVEYPDLVDRSLLLRTSFYLGRESVSAAHFHPDTQVVLCQVIGRKRFVFWPPDDLQNLYPVPWYTPNYNWSRINFDAPDVERQYPRLKRARRVECVVHAGEMLFVPVHWWHLVYGEGLSVSVTYIWRAQLRHFPRLTMHMVGAAVANNPLVAGLVRDRLARKEAEQKRIRQKEVS
jgi:hypothetical protein